MCTVRTTGHKFQHSRPLLVRPDTDAINPRVRRALFSSLFLKGFLILFLLFSFPLCVWAWLLAASTQQPASLHTTRRHGIYKRKEWITRKIKYKIRERKKYTRPGRVLLHTPKTNTFERTKENRTMLERILMEMPSIVSSQSERVSSSSFFIIFK